MVRTLAGFLLIVCLTLATRPQAAGQAPATVSLEASLDAVVTPFVTNQRVPGVSLAITADGRTLYAKGLGTTSLSEQKTPTKDTQYRLASVSKPFTAVAVFELVQDGKVKLDDPARAYCPELSMLDGMPTVRHFLMHRSGMRHTTNAEDTTIKGSVSRFGESLSKVAREPLQFAPGTKTLYTSWGYTALGCVIETASGKPYATFIRERVLAPAGMTSTAFDRPDFVSPTFSSGFRGGLLSGLRPSEVVDTRFKTPASGIISTVTDMSRFASALFEGRLVPAALVTEMFKVERDGDGRAGFTAGWTPKGRTAVGGVFDYNGSMEGSTAFLDMVPERRYALALLANRERFVPELQPVVNEARRLVLEAGAR
jgi:CubicO group peptidase (beta-lactamase class C family)